MSMRVYASQGWIVYFSFLTDDIGGVERAPWIHQEREVLILSLDVESLEIDWGFWDCVAW
jgi:hypothetical protein